MKPRHVIILLLLSLPFLVRDYTVANELKYISIAQEAIDNGTWFTFYNHGAAYADKPPLYLWIVMLSKLLFGDFDMWFIGLFSLLPMVGVMAVMNRWMRMECDHPNTYAADMMLATTGMFIGAGMVLRMDMLMTFFIVLSLYTFFRMYKGIAAPRERWLLPVYIFMALFTKGPYGVMIPLASIAAFLAWKRELHTFGRYFGWRQLGILVALCAVWWGAVYAEGGREYIEDLLFRQTVGRGIDSFHHKAPLWFYIVRLPLVMLPWSLLYIATFIAGLRKKFVCTDTERFFIVTIFATLAMLSAVSAKLDIYLIPMYPFVVYLCAMWMRRLENRRYVKFAAAFPCVVFAAALVAVPIVLHFGNFGEIPTWTLFCIYASATVLSVGGIWGLSDVLHDKASRGAVTASWAFVATVALATTAIPYFNPYLGYECLCEKARTFGIGEYAHYKIKYADNMDVFLGNVPHRMESVAELEAAERPTVLFVDDKQPRRDKEFAEWLSDKEVAAEVGNHKIVIIGANKEDKNE